MSSTPVGKTELLGWASELSGNTIGRFEDLKDGSVLVKLAFHIWPAAVELRARRRVKGAAGNWDLLKGIFTDLELPMAVYVPKGIQAGKFKPCYNLLVMLYFLYHLATQHDFSVDFAHPIDQRLAAYLRSSDCISALARGGGLKLPFEAATPDAANQVTRALAPALQTPIAEEEAAPPSPVEGLRGSARAQDEWRRSGQRTGPVEYEQGLSEQQRVDLIMSHHVPLKRESPSVSASSVGSSAGGESGSSATKPEGAAVAAPSLPRAQQAVSGGGYAAHYQQQIQYQQQKGRRGAAAKAPEEAAPAPHPPPQPNRYGYTDPSSGSPTPVLSPQQDLRVYQQLPALASAPSSAEGPPIRALPDFEPPHPSSRRQVSFIDEASAAEAGAGTGVGGGGAGAGREGELQWRDDRLQAKGEVLLADLRFQVESLQRQVDAAKNEREFLVKRYDLELSEAARLHESELSMQKDMLRAEAVTMELGLSAARAEDQRDFVMELQKLADKMRAAAPPCAPEEDRNESLIALKEREELSRLRQVVPVYMRQITGLEAHAKFLSEQNEKVKRQVVQEQQRNLKLHKGPPLAMGLVSPSDSGPEPSASPSAHEPALARELKEVKMELEAERLRFQREKEELAYEAFQARQQAAAATAPAVPAPALEMAAGEGTGAKGGAFKATLKEWEGEQRVQHLEGENHRLHSENRFLRKRGILFDERNGELGRPPLHMLPPALQPPPDPGAAGGEGPSAPPPSWLPRDDIEGMNHEADAAQLFALLEDTRQGLEKVRGWGEAGGHAIAQMAAGESLQRTEAVLALFWRSVMAQTLLRQRLVQARAELVALHRAAHDLRATHRSHQAEWEASTEAAAAEQAAQVSRLEAELNRERALASVKLHLEQARVAEALAEAEAARDRLDAVRREGAAAHERRFASMSAALREAKEEAAKMALREQHHAALAACQRRLVRSLEALVALHSAGPAGTPESTARMQQARAAVAAARAEAASHSEAIHAVGELMATGPAPDPHELAAEALTAVKSQLAEAEQVAADVRAQLGRKGEECGRAQVQMQRAQLAAEQAQRETAAAQERVGALQKQCRELQAAAAAQEAAFLLDTDRVRADLTETKVKLRTYQAMACAQPGALSALSPPSSGAEAALAGAGEGSPLAAHMEYLGGVRAAAASTEAAVLRARSLHPPRPAPSAPSAPEPPAASAWTAPAGGEARPSTTFSIDSPLNTSPFAFSSADAGSRRALTRFGQEPSEGTPKLNPMNRSLEREEMAVGEADETSEDLGGPGRTPPEASGDNGEAMSHASSPGDPSDHSVGSQPRPLLDPPDEVAQVLQHAKQRRESRRQRDLEESLSQEATPLVRMDDQ